MGTCTADAMALIGPRWCSIIVAILYNSLIQFLNESIFKSYAFAGASLAGLRPFYTRAPRLNHVMLILACGSQATVSAVIVHAYACTVDEAFRLLH